MHRLADRPAGGRPENGEQRQVLPQRSAGRSSFRVEDPPRRAPFVGAQTPALAGAEVGKIKLGAVGPGHLSERSDALQIVDRSVVARQQEVRAIVDVRAQHRVEIGPAAPARRAGRFMNDRFDARSGQARRRCQPRHSCADHMDRAAGHRSP